MESGRTRSFYVGHLQHTKPTSRENQPVNRAKNVVILPTLASKWPLNGHPCYNIVPAPSKPIITHYHQNLRLQQLNHACNIDQKLRWLGPSLSNKKPTHRSCFARFKIQKQQYAQLNNMVPWNNLWPSSTIMKIDNSIMPRMAMKNCAHWYHLQHPKLLRESKNKRQQQQQ